jgi:hypothetical protein
MVAAPMSPLRVALLQRWIAALMAAVLLVGVQRAAVNRAHCKRAWRLGHVTQPLHAVVSANARTDSGSVLEAVDDAHEEAGVPSATPCPITVAALPSPLAVLEPSAWTEVCLGTCAPREGSWATLDPLERPPRRA